MSIDQAFAQTDLVKPSDNSRLRNENKYKPERKDYHQTKESERFSDTIKRQSRENKEVSAPNRQESQKPDSPSEQAEPAVETNPANETAHVEPAEQAPIELVLPTSILSNQINDGTEPATTQQSADMLEGLPNDLTLKSDAGLLNAATGSEVATQTLNNSAVSVELKPEDEVATLTNIPKVEKSAEGMPTVDSRSPETINLQQNNTALQGLNQTENGELAPQIISDQKSQMGAEQGQTQAQTNLNPQAQQEGQTEEETFRPVINQANNQNNIQSNNNIVGSNQSGISIQDMQAVHQAQKTEAPQSPAQQDLNAMDKAVGKQIERAVVQQLQNGQKVLQIRLTPPELGTVRVEILDQNGRMTVRLNAEDDSVRHSLEKVLPQLRNDIRAGNAPIAEIQLTDHSLFMNQRQTQQQQQQRRQRQGTTNFSLNGVQAQSENTELKPRQDGITINQQGVSGMI